jgi:coenzyme F420-0:L-glutamate ligase/coenzyme F420-1:gamma-L-glutamate ligase
MFENNYVKWMMMRRSYRRFHPEPVEADVVEESFAVIHDDDVKARLASAMGERLRADLTVDGVPTHLIEKDAGRSYARITGAPLLVLLCLSMVDMDDYPDAQRREKERHMAIQSAAMAGQNLLLAAHAHGLGACWMCAPLFCPEVVRDTLELPADWEPQGLVTVGRPAERRKKGRVPLNTRVLYLS